MIALTLRIDSLLTKKLPQYSCLDGTSNVWICKPSYNARGHGIFCFNDQNVVINNFLKTNSVPKVVQKYIERPLLLKMNGENRKFDIRQWVLLLNYDDGRLPEIYVYKRAYLRIC